MDETRTNFEQQVIGKTVEEAKQLGDQHGFLVRTSKKDGESLMLTMDYRPTRLNVETINNRVTAVHKWG